MTEAAQHQIPFGVDYANVIVRTLKQSLFCWTSTNIRRRKAFNNFKGLWNILKC